MKIQVVKHYFYGNDDKDINFFTGIYTTPVMRGMDLYDYLIKDGLSEFAYEIEGVDSENSIYTKCSNVTLTCKNDIYNGYNLVDFFELYLQNKYVRFKVYFYDEDDVLFYSGIITTDGIEIPDLRDDLLSITVLGYEKEFKEGFSNIPLLDASSLNYDMPPGTPLNITELYFYTAGRLIKYNFGNILDADSLAYLNNIFIAKNPYTYAYASGITSRFEDYSTNTFHIKTGYGNFYRDEIDRFAWFDSLCLSMGWVWFFHLGKLVILERRDNDFDIHNIDYDSLIIRNGLTNRVEQFQCANVAITSGEYFDKGGDGVHLFRNGSSFIVGGIQNTAGSQVTMYSNSNYYDNRQRPFIRFYLRGVLGYYYTLDSYNHHFTMKDTEDNYNYVLKNYYTIPFQEPDIAHYRYDKKKTITINPYICSKRNAGCIDTTRARDTSGEAYGNGNFYMNRDSETTFEEFQGGYTGHAGHSVVTYNSVTGKLQTYEFYSQSENFKANFKKFVKTNEDVILEIEVAELITNPLQRIHIDNFPYYDIDSKDFIIESLSFNYFDKTTILKIRMI